MCPLLAIFMKSKSELSLVFLNKNKFQKNKTSLHHVDDVHHYPVLLREGVFKSFSHKIYSMNFLPVGNYSECGRNSLLLISNRYIFCCSLFVAFKIVISLLSDHTQTSRNNGIRE